MPEDKTRILRQGPGVPCTITIGREDGHWQMRLWYHGHTITEALNPVLLGEYPIPPDRLPLNARWADLFREVALAVEDLATGAGCEVY